MKHIRAISFAILTGVTLLFARSMRVEAISANNRVSAVQAAAVVRGAEQYVLALAESAAGDPSSIVEAPAESLAVVELMDAMRALARVQHEAVTCIECLAAWKPT